MQNFYHVLPEYYNFILYLSESAYEEREHVAAQEIPVQIAQFAHVEDQLTTRRPRVQEDNDCRRRFGRDPFLDGFTGLRRPEVNGVGRRSSLTSRRFPPALVYSVYPRR